MLNCLHMSAKMSIFATCFKKGTLSAVFISCFKNIP